MLVKKCRVIQAGIWTNVFHLSSGSGSSSAMIEMGLDGSGSDQ